MDWLISSTDFVEWYIIRSYELTKSQFTWHGILVMKIPYQNKNSSYSSLNQNLFMDCTPNAIDQLEIFGTILKILGNSKTKIYGRRYTAQLSGIRGAGCQNNFDVQRNVQPYRRNRNAVGSEFGRFEWNIIRIINIFYSFNDLPNRNFLFLTDPNYLLLLIKQYW